MPGDVKMEPIGSEYPGLETGGVRDCDYEGAARFQHTGEGLDRRARVAQVFKPVPDCYAIEWGSIAKLVDGFAHVEVGAPGDGRIYLGAGYAPPGVAGCQQECSVSATDVEQGPFGPGAGRGVDNSKAAAGTVPGGKAVTPAVIILAVIGIEVFWLWNGVSESAISTLVNGKAFAGACIEHPGKAWSERSMANIAA